MPVSNSSDDRSAIAQAWAWSSRITAIALEMALPAAAGYWLDEKLGTGLVFLMVGVILGMTLGLTSLMRIAATSEKEDRRRRMPSDDQRD